MYHAHFGLKKGLFSDGIAADTAVFRSPKHDRFIANCRGALTSPSSVIVVTGPAGVGKTTVAATALRASSTRLALAWLNGMPTNATELLELLLIELGIATVRTSRIERLQLWRQFQSEMSTTESRVFVVVEHTEDLSHEVLRALDSLTSPDPAGNSGTNVVLLGQPGLDRHLAAPALDSLRQRIRLRAQLEAFTAAELQDYLRHQVACAGGHYDEMFAPGTVAALHRYSGGVARLANNICETALTLAASQQQKPLTAEMVTTAAVSLLGLEELAPTVAAAAPLPAAAATMPPEVAKTPLVLAESSPPAATNAAAKAETTAAARTAPAAAPATPTPTASTATTSATPAPAPAPASLATAPSATATAPPPAAAAREFDGGATDIPDVSVTDFPILTDAVEFAGAAAAVPQRPAPLAQPSPVKPAATARSAPPPAPVAARPTSVATAPIRRVETAYVATKAAAPAKASPPAAPPQPSPAAVAAPVAPTATPKPAAATPSTPPAAAKGPSGPQPDDVLRQTQTMRAISVAKSIDDISNSMAETLFGDAELDLLTAALTSSAGWSDDEPPAEPVTPPEPKKAPTKAAAPPGDDLLELLGLGPDAPLELIDDSRPQPTGAPRKTATQG